jgi:hypothetical protein
MKNKFVRFLILSITLNNLKILKAPEKKDFFEISFDKIFPDSQIEQLQRLIINLSCIINNSDINNFNAIEEILVNDLMDIYALTYSLKDGIKRNTKFQKDDLAFLAKFIEFNKNNFKAKFPTNSAYVNIIFDKVLAEIYKAVNKF